MPHLPARAGERAKGGEVDLGVDAGRADRGVPEELAYLAEEAPAASMSLAAVWRRQCAPTLSTPARRHAS